MKILVVEDEKKTADFIRMGLEEQGYAVTVSRHGDEAYDLARNQSFDFMIMDIMLPGRDGLSILKNLRLQGSEMPIILLTARSETNERIEGLDLGADDYISKPFFVEELVARIRAILRRGEGRHNLLTADGLTVNPATREVLINDQPVDLSPREFSLLVYLLRSPGRVFTRTQILEHVWGYDFDPQTNMVDVCIQRLRKKLEIADASQTFIETVRGVGYRFRMNES